MTYIVNVNEITVFQLVILALFRRNPYVLAVEPLFPPTRRLLQPIVDKLIASGRARWIIDLCPELEREWEYPTRVNFYNIYAELEEWQDDYYGFDKADRMVPDYARAYKLVTCKHTSNKRFSLLLMKAALDGRRVRISGVAADTVAAMEAYWGQDFSPAIKPFWTPNYLVNLITGFGLTLFSLGWVISRTRLARPLPQSFFLAADYMEDARDFRLYHELAEGGPILLVERYSSKKVDRHKELGSYYKCLPEDGRFGVSDVFGVFWFVVRDALRLYRCFHKLPPALYYQAASLPYRRAVLRAFFNRFKPRYFWCRDDYNVEHVLRRDEIHRIGGKSFGVNHGVPVECLVIGEFRYNSFDNYYVFGKESHVPEMKRHWAEDMKVIPIGSFGASREDYRLRFKDRPDDIIIFVGFFVGLERCVEMVRTVASAFPDRKVMLQVKGTFIDRANSHNFIAACRKNLPNIEPVRGKAGLFFPRAKYSFCDPSMVVAEAIQFGLLSFCIDLSEVQKVGIYREFPGLCVTSGEEAVSRIKAIESGTWQYPIENYRNLIDLSGTVFFDRIRQDMGLPAKELAIPLIKINAEEEKRANRL